MTQDQKDLLLQDLCARLPYGVKVQVDLQSDIYPTITCKVCSIEYSESGSAFIGVETSTDTYNEFREFLCKPYLFPLSSITDEQKKELNKLSEKECYIIEDIVNNPTSSNVGFPVVVHYMVDWCNENHFDYRGLIPMGLANDATGLNIY